MSATIRALARLLDASYLDGPPTDGQRDMWREAAAKARDEHDQMVAVLRKIATWREGCHENDRSMSLEPRAFGANDVAWLEMLASKALRGLR